MKVLITLFILAFSQTSFAQLCEVYGISDSPQQLDCSFENQKISLRCDEGTYRLNGSPVKVAFHMEVEEGPVPLVFKTEESTLTVLINSKNDIAAEFAQKSESFLGKCQ